MMPSLPSPLDIKELTFNELKDHLVRASYPAFHAQQIFGWIYQKAAQDFDDMTGLPAKLRAQLKKDFSFSSAWLKEKKVSRDKTVKFLFKVGDDESVETVLIPSPKRGTLCVSTQVGCKFKCAFCASGLNGWSRDLSCAEILDQVLFVKRAASPARITHIVFMGIGEPFDNYDNVIKAIRRINAKEALGIAARRITVSTCGLVPQIELFAREPLQVELAVSLHAADDELRSKLMPVNRLYPLKELMACCRRYANETGRQVTFEYVLMKDINTSLEHARRLAHLLQGFLSKVNLIVYNENVSLGFRSPSRAEVLAFKECLEQQRIPSTIRTPRGSDIAAACGQLRFQAKS